MSGIRRVSRAGSVLATNIDILFSERAGSFFRGTRSSPDACPTWIAHDDMSQIPVDAPVEEQLAYCRTHADPPSNTPARARFSVLAGCASFARARRCRPPSIPEFYLARVASGGTLHQTGAFFAGRPARRTPARKRAGAGVRLVGRSRNRAGDGRRTARSRSRWRRTPGLDARKVARRSRLRLPFAPPLPARLLFRVQRRRLPTSRDPRVLDFRAFRLEWERLRKGRGATRASLRPIRRTNRVMGAWLALQHVVDRLAKGRAPGHPHGPGCSAPAAVF